MAEPQVYFPLCFPVCTACCLCNFHFSLAVAAPSKCFSGELVKHCVHQINLQKWLTQRTWSSSFWSQHTQMPVGDKQRTFRYLTRVGGEGEEQWRLAHLSLFSLRSTVLTATVLTIWRAQWLKASFCHCFLATDRKTDYIQVKFF